MKAMNANIMRLVIEEIPRDIAEMADIRLCIFSARTLREIRS